MPPVYSRTLPLPSDVRWRRLIGVALFLGLLYFFRHLAPVFICFVIIERSLGWAADQIDRRTPLHRTGAIASLLTAIAVLIGLGVFIAVRRSLPLIQRLRAHGAEYLRSIFDHPQIERLRNMAGLEDESFTRVFRDHAGTAVKYATSTAHLLLFMLIGFVLAIIYLFERDTIHKWMGGMEPSSVQGTLMRWFGYVGDAIAVTIRMQVVVAIVNAVVTLPVLLLLGLPHVPLLFLLILVTGLLPVVGNFISGAVLCYVAYTAQGLWAVGVFLGVTFVLGKVESYYLNPRLASAHVKLPSLVLVISLLLFEQAFGFVGLFLSFPALFVGSRIANEWREEKAVVEATVAAATAAEIAHDVEAESAAAEPTVEVPPSVEETPPTETLPAEPEPTALAEAPTPTEAPPTEEPSSTA
jgi:predicted PurR-regulated permease PerM